MSKYVIVVGNLPSGIEKIIGPFDNLRAADKWASENVGDSPYHPCLPLEVPEPTEAA